VPPPATSVREHLLHELGTAFAARLELDELVPLVVRRCPEALDAEGASVLLLDDGGTHLHFPYVAAEAEVAKRLTSLRIPADRGVAGAVLRSGEPLRIDDAPSDPRFNADVDRATGFTTRAIMCVPLRGRSGVLGVLQVVNPRHRAAFDDAELRFLDALAGSVAVALENARLFATVRESASRLHEQVGALRRDVVRLERQSDLLGTAPSLDEVRRLMDSAAASPITVLIEGETGTGKELVARGIHRASARGDHAFVAVNCAALTETLVESELFGHKKGSFTGATQDRAGYFEAAGGGTVFLDEVGELPPVLQAKLLRVLQEGEVVPVGDHRPRKVDVRVIAATNRDLSGASVDGRFRPDLYYRLAGFPIRLPPLRERPGDVRLLAERFLDGAAARHEKRFPGLLPASIDALEAWHWPGNVRELQNEIERAAALARDGDAIAPAHLSRRLLADAAAPAVPAPAAATAGAVAPLRDARLTFEIRYLADALRTFGGNVSQTARALGISRVMLQKKMKQLGLRHEP